MRVIKVTSVTRRRAMLAGGLLLAASAALMDAIGAEAADGTPTMTIRITSAPPPGSGPDSWGIIAGTTTGANPAEQRVVIYTRTNQWYVQPWIAAPYTDLHRDGSFRTGTHLGYEYAAILIEDRSFVPPATLNELPGIGGAVRAVARANAGGQ
jgi:hypothetical protein